MRRPILVSRRRYSGLIVRAWDRRERTIERLRAEAIRRGDTMVRGIPRDPMWGDAISGRIPRHRTARQRTLDRRRLASCHHAHISGGGVNYWGEPEDWQCDDCGECCPDVENRVTAANPQEDETDAR